MDHVSAPSPAAATMRTTEVRHPDPPGTTPVDLTVVAVPGYFAAMGLEYWPQRRRQARGAPRPPATTRRGTPWPAWPWGASACWPRSSCRGCSGPGDPGPGPVRQGAGRGGRRRGGRDDGGGRAGPPGRATGRRGTAGARDGRLAPPGRRPTARKVASIGGVAAVAVGGVAVTTAWAAATTPERLWERRLVRSLGTGPLTLAAAIVGWDFLYYWNHRFMHTSRYMWAVHEVHHSSERYNLSTALRQPVADALGTSIPYGLLCLFGIPPSAVATARGVNLIYQFWIHTEAIDRIGRAESTLNSPSHHRVHHGSNRQYLDRNHGGILIVWDRMFGTFEPEDEPVVYGLTKNIHTFDPARIASHEYVDMARDIASSTGWVERLSYVFRGPGWAMRHRAPGPVAGPAPAAVGTRRRTRADGTGGSDPLRQHERGPHARHRNRGRPVGADHATRQLVVHHVPGRGGRPAGPRLPGGLDPADLSVAGRRGPARVAPRAG